MPLFGKPGFVTISFRQNSLPLQAYHFDNPGSRSIKEIRRPYARPPHFGRQLETLSLYRWGDSLVGSVLLTGMVKSPHPTEGFNRPHPIVAIALHKAKMSNIDQRSEQY